MATINLFRNATDVECFAPGQRIFEEGQPGNTMYHFSLQVMRVMADRLRRMNARV